MCVCVCLSLPLCSRMRSLGFIVFFFFFLPAVGALYCRCRLENVVRWLSSPRSGCSDSRLWLSVFKSSVQPSPPPPPPPSLNQKEKTKKKKKRKRRKRKKKKKEKKKSCHDRRCQNLSPWKQCSKVWSVDPHCDCNQSDFRKKLSEVHYFTLKCGVGTSAWIWLCVCVLGDVCEDWRAGNWLITPPWGSQMVLYPVLHLFPSLDEALQHLKSSWDADS